MPTDQTEQNFLFFLFYFPSNTISIGSHNYNLKKIEKNEKKKPD